MKSYLKIISIIFLTILIPCSSFCLEKLSLVEMKAATAQAGISVAFSDSTIGNFADSIRFSNTEDESSYIELQDLESLININCGVSDIDNDGNIGHFTLDFFSVDDALSPVNEKPFLFVDVNDLDINWDMSIGQISVCGQDTGSLKIDNISIPLFHIYLGAHGCGIDAEFGFQSRIGAIEFEFNPLAADAGKLSITGISFAASFAGEDNDPSTWVAENKFIVGDALNDNPITFDVGDDHIAIKTANISGSFRIENIDFGGVDMGLVLLDDINVQRLDIEIPGRGLGRQ